MSDIDSQMRDNSLQEEQIVAHSILLFFAMEKEGRETYLPSIDPKIEYVWDGDTGGTTPYPAHYFSMRAVAYLEMFRPKVDRTIGGIVYEMREVMYLMAEISPYPLHTKGLYQYSYLWLFGPPYSGVSGSASILWRFLRRYARRILASPVWTLDHPMLSFEDMTKQLKAG